VPDRVDLSYVYTRLPSKPSVAFPAKSEVWLPVVNLGIIHGKEGRRTYAMLDTGAEYSFFGTQIADLLGIDWRSAPEVPFDGIGSHKNPGYAVDVKLVLPDARYDWPARVVFSPALNNFRFPLLGHAGFFEHFEVRFKSAQRHFRINLR